MLKNALARHLDCWIMDLLSLIVMALVLLKRSVSEFQHLGWVSECGFISANTADVLALPLNIFPCHQIVR
jgi:hypothetical protein